MSDDTAQGHLKRFSMYLKVGIWAIVLFVLLAGASYVQKTNIGETLLGLSKGYVITYFGDPSAIGLKIAEQAKYLADNNDDYIKVFNRMFNGIACNVNDEDLEACNRFAIVVMRSTGADVKIDGVAYAQLDYVRSSPCYVTFAYKSEAEMLPGDLIYQDHIVGRKNGHVAIFIGGNDPRGRWAQASIGTRGHPPEIGDVDSGMTVVARLKNGPCL